MSAPSKVWMTKRITPDSLMDLYKALGRKAQGKVAVKIHMGEAGNTNYLSPDLVKELVKSVDGTFVDSNTFYEGTRSSTADHIKTAKDHGFTYAPVDILDADGEMTLPTGLTDGLKEAVLGSHYQNYDFLLSIAHFKGHAMAGFGGTFKNLAIGIASARGKGIVHGNWNATEEEFQHNVVAYTKAVMDDKGDQIIYINVLNNLSVDCDCDAKAAHPDMDDIGILASLDPVALDKASVDQVYAAPHNEHLVERIESRHGLNTLQYAASLNLGSLEYELIDIDKK